MISPRRRRVIVAQTLLIGIVAATLAVPIGIVVASYLVRVINVHAFGWTMPLTIPNSLLLLAWGGVVLAAVFAALIPVLHVTRRPPALAFDDE